MIKENLARESKNLIFFSIKERGEEFFFLTPFFTRAVIIIIIIVKIQVDDNRATTIVEGQKYTRVEKRVR